MRILLDTNILIPLETPHRLIDGKIARLMKLSAKFKIDTLIHDANFEDIRRYGNDIGREIVLRRLERYNKLEYASEPDSNFLKKINSSYDTARVKYDDKLLYALFKNSAHLLITNDNGIHSKAKLLGIEAKVYRLEQALSFIEKTFCEKEIKLKKMRLFICHHMILTL